MKLLRRVVEKIAYFGEMVFAPLLAVVLFETSTLTTGDAAVLGAAGIVAWTLAARALITEAARPPGRRAQPACRKRRWIIRVAPIPPPARLRPQASRWARILNRRHRSGDRKAWLEGRSCRLHSLPPVETKLAKQRYHSAKPKCGICSLQDLASNK
jgi:hypothetical protein